VQRSTVENKPTTHLPWKTLLGFGQLAVPLATAGLPIAVFVTAFYAKDIHIKLADVGIILFLARITDFIVDPVIGYVSDRTTWGIGRRRTWVFLGIPIFALGVYMLFLPPAILMQQSMTGREVYLLIWISIYYLGWTMITIPYGAWGAELSDDYNERSRITGVREIFTLIGLALAGSIPVLLGSASPEATAAGARAAGNLWEVMAVLGISILVLTPVGAAILYFTTPEPPVKEMEHIPVWRAVKAAATNWPFLRLFASIIGIRMGSRGAESLLLFYLVDAAGLAQSEASKSLLALLVASIFFAPFWIWAGTAWTKHRALSIAMIAGILVFAMLPALRGAGFWPNILAFAALGAAFSAPFTLGQSMAADVVDLDSLRTRQPRAGLLISFFGIAIKGGDMLGVVLALFCAGYFGYVPSDPVKTHHAVQVLSAVYVLFPILFWIPSIALIWNFPITPAVQHRIRALIEKRVRLEHSGKLRKSVGRT
jgi:GPH family glycoside/pentoside/hexuronide:cation symporter